MFFVRPCMLANQKQVLDKLANQKTVTCNKLTNNLPIFQVTRVT